MTAQPEGQPGQASAINEPHRARRVAESFGSDAERYDRARPRYPDAMVEAIVTASPGAEVLDVGCGTGIAARQFQALGCRVLGVDPDARMAGLAWRFGVEAEVAKFEDWDPAGREFDAAIAGQAWHWVDPVAGAAKAAQVLRPGGRLALFWNSFRPPADVDEAFAEVYRRVFRLGVQPRGDGRPGRVLGDVHEGGGRDAAGGRVRRPGGVAIRLAPALHPRRVAGGASYLGGYSQYPPATQQELLAGIGAAIDAVGGSFTMGYTAVVATAARSGVT